MSSDWKSNIRLYASAGLTSIWCGILTTLTAYKRASTHRTASGSRMCLSRTRWMISRHSETRLSM
ncbi:hypothetical protein DPMN_082296 [Dreissena polymorpha]|uniref:Uncharacterized protein n=1 Tax=Dreissena polymorpha TaxID=45954 RepID=A0A9D4BGQ5_DREPO|nr:hypothetical protein DPMN_082296 [Dreissena polymorpha]